MTSEDCIVARAECLSVMMAYCVTQDQEDAEAFAELFHPDGTWFLSNGEEISGIADIREKTVNDIAYRVQGGVRSKHLLTSAHVTVESLETAHCESYSLVFEVARSAPVPSGLPRFTAIMTYKTEFQRLGEGKWRIFKQRGENHMSGQRSSGSVLPLS